MLRLPLRNGLRQSGRMIARRQGEAGAEVRVMAEGGMEEKGALMVARAPGERPYDSVVRIVVWIVFLIVALLGSGYNSLIYLI